MGHLARAGKADIKEVFNHCKKIHSVYSHHDKGFSKERQGFFGRHVTSIPIECFSDPEYRKYLDPKIPYEDRAKEMDKLLRRLDWFDFRKM